jgi:hypothetical protein
VPYNCVSCIWYLLCSLFIWSSWQLCLMKHPSGVAWPDAVVPVIVRNRFHPCLALTMHKLSFGGNHWCIKPGPPRRLEWWRCYVVGEYCGWIISHIRNIRFEILGLETGQVVTRTHEVMTAATSSIVRSYSELYYQRVDFFLRAAYKVPCTSFRTTQCN